MKVSKRERVLLLILLVLAIGTGYYFLFFTNWQKQIDELDTKIFNETSEYNEIAVNEKRIDDIDKRISTLEETEEVKKLFSMGDYFHETETIKEIERIYLKNSSQLNRVEISTGTTHDGSFILTDITIKMKTGFKDFQGVLRDFSLSSISNRILTSKMKYNNVDNIWDTEFIIQYPHLIAALPNAEPSDK